MICQNKCYILQLPIPIDEFERKRVFKCTFVNSHLKEDVSYSETFYNVDHILVLQKEITVYVNKDGTVKDLLEEATEHIEFTDTTKQLRYIHMYALCMYVCICTYECILFLCVQSRVCSYILPDDLTLVEM